MFILALKRNEFDAEDETTPAKLCQPRANGAFANYVNRTNCS